MKKPKALVLFSGGLDSTLAVKLLQEQDINVMAIIFKSYFWDTTQAENTAKKLKTPYFVEDFSQEHLKIVKNPPHGYGKAANPCVDCHALMLKIAASFTSEESDVLQSRTLPPRRWGMFDFIATGEVLGERPFSQNKKALLLIAKESGLNDRLLRPLSAKLLPITLPEKKGWVDREKLRAIKGRSRQPQIALAKKFGIKDYPQPAGGCILTEKEYSKKLFNLLKHWPDATGNDIKLLRMGRVFWKDKILQIIGRNQEENEKLEKAAKKGDAIIKPKNFPGPTVLARSKKNKLLKKTTNQAKKIILRHSAKAPNKPEFMIK